MWLVIMDGRYRAFTTIQKAMAYVETTVAEGGDMTLDQMYAAGWRWVLPMDNPEGEHNYFVCLRRPALTAEVIRLGVD